jgi:diguanylate cyclase (GGDEF)-like protein
MNFALHDVCVLKPRIGDAAEDCLDGGESLSLGGGIGVDTDVSSPGPAVSSNSISHSNGTDRRVNHERRKRLNQMSRAELIRELMTDGLTGLPNQRTYDEAARKPCQAVLDVEGLKWLNDRFGHAAGDALLCAVAAALREFGVEAYRAHGDEFVCQFESETEAQDHLAQLADRLKLMTFSFPAEDGTHRSYRGIGIRFGIGDSLVAAEFELVRAREGREKNGLRARRGEKSMHMIEVG